MGRLQVAHCSIWRFLNVCTEPDASLDVFNRGGSKKSKFVGLSFELLPVAERAQQYREMADATFLKAHKLEDPMLRTRYLDLAANWHALAQQLEAGVDPEAATPSWWPSTSELPGTK
jgi:hypothetical protein